MAKRRYRRHIRRLETEFAGDGKDYRGISSDISCNGMFIRTNHAFPPGTILNIKIHLPDGNTSRVRGRVMHSMKTHVVSLRNGMGIEFIEKDASYAKFLEEYDPDCLDSTPKENVLRMPANEEKTSFAEADSRPPDFIIITCHNCGVKNKVSSARLGQGPKCGKCGGLLPITL